MKIGYILIITGLILIIPITIYIINEQYASPYGIPTPAGIGGIVTFPNGTIVPDGTPIIAKNVNTNETVIRYTENGYYAIGMSARTGDVVELYCNYNNMSAENYTIIDLDRTTNWCNLTLGRQVTKNIDWWLYMIPLSMIGGGYYINYRKKH